MIIEPKIRGFICTTAHPDGCKANVKSQIEHVKSKGVINHNTNTPKKVLVIGASAGYGLSSRITATFGCGADTIGVIFDKEASGKRTASAGYYNTKAFEDFATLDGFYSKTINGDAFSQSVKDETIALIKKDLGKVDMVVYSLASPRRTVQDGTTYSSVLKTTGDEYTNKTIDLKAKKIIDVTIPPAIPEEIEHTVKVMGGEDWMDWIDALKHADAIEDNAITLAYSYIGPEVTHPMYLNGSIGMAKKHLHNTAKQITDKYATSNIKGFVSVNKALVTQSSSAIPIVPLYISILYKVMKEDNVHEGCIEQIYRMFDEHVFDGEVKVDSQGLIRIDDLEMQPHIQAKVTDIWNKINDDNIELLADIEGYWKDFYQIFGFDVDGVDYSLETSL